MMDDLYPDLEPIHSVIERAFRDTNYKKYTSEGVTVHQGANFGPDTEPGSPTFGQDMILSNDTFYPNKTISKKVNNMFHYKILLIGASGRGKTYSFRNLDRDSTGFINVENKPFPFKGTFNKMVIPNTFSEVLAAITRADANPDIKCLVIDSFSAYIDMLMLEARATKTGWSIMTFYNENIGKFNDYVKRVNKPVFVTAHYELLGDESGLGREKRAKVKGKEWEGFLEKDYTIVLYAESKMVLGKKLPEYFFTLVNDGTNSAKTPPDIFGPDTLTLENDCKIVLDKIIEFQK